MKIVSCITSPEEVGPLACAGADEMYSSVSDAWGFSSRGVRDMSELALCAEKAHAAGKKFSMAFNDLCAMAQKDVVLHVREACALPVDSFIVTLPYLLELFGTYKQSCQKLHLSSLQPCFSVESAEFFSGFGVSRFIFSNLLTPGEASRTVSFCKKRKIETEIFDYRFFGCQYVNGRCRNVDVLYPEEKEEKEFLSGPGSNGAEVFPPERICRCDSVGCHLNIKRDPSSVPAPAGIAPGREKEASENAVSIQERMLRGGHPSVGNPSSLFDFYTLGADYIKNPVRNDDTKRKTATVREMRRTVNLLGELSAKYRPSEAKARFILYMERWNG